MLVDIRMDSMDGYEFVKQIRNNITIKNISIIFVSCLEKETQLSKAREFGVNSYIEKPIDAEVLHSVVESFLPL